jgi:DnaJ-class molecular chaperone
VRVDIDVPKKLSEEQKEALKAYAQVSGDAVTPVSDTWKNKFKRFFG